MTNAMYDNYPLHGGNNEPAHNVDHSAYYGSLHMLNKSPYYNNPNDTYQNNRNQYYNLENAPATKNYSCKICNKDFFSHGMYKKHIDSHESCPFPKCKFTASFKMIDQHISHQHMLVNFEELQMDDEAWIADRKKRFPTIQRAELRRSVQMEKLKRGERLGKNNKKFNNSKGGGKVYSNKFMKKDSNDDRENTKPRFSERDNKDKANRRNTFKHKRPMQQPSVDPYESDPEMRQGIPAFKGTTALFESTGEVSIFGVNSSSIPVDKEPDIHISDEDEEWNDGNKTELPTSTSTIQNALGSLMGAYNSDSESDSEKCDNDIKITASDNLKSENKINDTVTKTQDTMQIPNESTNLKIEPQSSNVEKISGNRKRKHNTMGKDGEPKKKNTTPRPPFNKRRRPTLLEKLLQPNIIHERNLILQCVRYIVQNYFFDESSKT